MRPLAKWAWIGLLPQMTFWIFYTLVVGSLSGTIAAVIARRGDAATA